MSTTGILSPLAYISNENALAVDPQQNVYVAVGSGQIGGEVIDKVTPTGSVSTYAHPF